ncbi:hypothetical protein D910_06280 [Dendroctonus ponderosae]|uniref:Uncharacterized protein n=1 Tax=Dendroctonus ponderosae TaxID=77166 RepID=U4U4T8_DENPD|nr:hypothetical protein D910_06280 [Dendroctonus ponderosae]
MMEEVGLNANEKISNSGIDQMEDEGLDSDADAQDSDGMTVDDDSDDGDDEDLGNHLMNLLTKKYLPDKSRTVSLERY